MRFSRLFTDGKRNVFDHFEFETRTASINAPDGSIVFQQHDVEVPVSWSQTATDILAQKYFRKAGVPADDGKTGGERSVRQVVHRMAETWRSFGEQLGYFRTPEDAAAFYDETVYMLLDQSASPNSPQWFNTGLYHIYGISGPPQGHYHMDPSSGEAVLSSSAYEYPQPHACFILSVKDDLVNPGGIMDLLVREARIFKYGSGVGTNFSPIRSERERLSGGGYSSGLMSFLRIGDAAAGAIRSGGTTRRAAKMVCLDIDHPEIRAFIRWKMDEERKANVLIGAGYDGSYEGEAYRSVSGQNSNNSVRVTDDFMRALKGDEKWTLKGRLGGALLSALPARELWRDIANAAWSCGDPGVQFDTTINDWHTCPAGGRIHASNPCSEYMFLDDTACNLASLNLMKFTDSITGEFDISRFRHACRIWTTVLDISVSMAQYPSREVAINSTAYRTVGLGFTNLGAVIMRNGWPYDSAKARGFASGVAALMTGSAYSASAELAAELTPFPRFNDNKDAMLHVMRNHSAAIASDYGSLSGLSVTPVLPKEADVPLPLLEESRKVWKEVCREGEKHGFRNAQVTVVAPTGTIGLVMDCDTTGIEPEFSLVKDKKLSGGGVLRIVNAQLRPALQRLGYPADQIDELSRYAEIYGTVAGAPRLDPSHVPVFSCAGTAGAGHADNTVSVEGHLAMMAAVQPFISGAISKTVNLPNSATVDAVGECFRRGWELGLKSVAVYRDGCKQSQPLNVLRPAASETPLCADCGFRTRRDGSCFKCENCGATTSCS
jgi:ribonucleoside-diphosphate reductase alpha chain